MLSEKVCTILFLLLHGTVQGEIRSMHEVRNGNRLEYRAMGDNGVMRDYDNYIVR